MVYGGDNCRGICLDIPSDGAARYGCVCRAGAGAAGGFRVDASFLRATAHPELVIRPGMVLDSGYFRNTWGTTRLAAAAVDAGLGERARRVSDRVRAAGNLLGQRDLAVAYSWRE